MVSDGLYECRRLRDDIERGESEVPGLQLSKSLIRQMQAKLNYTKGTVNGLACSNRERMLRLWRCLESERRMLVEVNGVSYCFLAQGGR